MLGRQRVLGVPNTHHKLHASEDRNKTLLFSDSLSVSNDSVIFQKMFNTEANSSQLSVAVTSSEAAAVQAPLESIQAPHRWCRQEFGWQTKQGNASPTDLIEKLKRREQLWKYPERYHRAINHPMSGQLLHNLSLYIRKIVS